MTTERGGLDRLRRPGRQHRRDHVRADPRDGRRRGGARVQQEHSVRLFPTGREHLSKDGFESVRLSQSHISSLNLFNRTLGPPAEFLVFTDTIGPTAEKNATSPNSAR